MTALRILAALTLMIVATSADAKEDYVYGPPPDWAHYRQLGEAAVRAALPDQASWQVEWPNGYVKAGWNHKGPVSGYTTCGVLRATGPVTGHYPLIDFVVVIDRDEVKRIDISPRDTRSLVTVICRMLITQGRIPPASLMATTLADLDVPTLGVTVRPMPEGAYIAAVMPDSAASRAGLVAGTVITRANGIALAGMGAAIAKLLGADTATLALDTAAGGHVEIKRER